jgi:hypothetical protein
LAADIVGYSRLVEKDEAVTLTALRKLRAEVRIRLNPNLPFIAHRPEPGFGSHAGMRRGAGGGELTCASAS